MRVNSVHPDGIYTPMMEASLRGGRPAWTRAPAVRPQAQPQERPRLHARQGGQRWCLPGLATTPRRQRRRDACRQRDPGDGVVLGRWALVTPASRGPARPVALAARCACARWSRRRTTAKSIVFDVPAAWPRPSATARPVPDPAPAGGRSPPAALLFDVQRAGGGRRATRVTVKRVDRGRGSNWLCDHCKPGTLLEVLPPAGVFTPRSLDGDFLLLAGRQRHHAGILDPALGAGRRDRDASR
jgi:hypothetical protein